MLVAALTNFGVKNQVPQFFFKFVDGDLVLVYSYEVADILFCESLDIYEAISDYGAQAFALQSPRDSLPLVTSSSPHRTSKEEDILHPLGHLLLRFGADFTSHGLLFKAATYQFLECSTHDSVECIVFLPKWKIPPDIFTKRFSEKKFTYLRSLLGVSSSG